MVGHGFFCKALFFQSAFARAGAIEQVFNGQVGGLFHAQALQRHHGSQKEPHIGDRKGGQLICSQLL